MILVISGGLVFVFVFVFLLEKVFEGHRGGGSLDCWEVELRAS